MFNDNKIIFLISQPRSGSTLLQLILANHPDILTYSETWIALHPIYALKRRGIKTIYQASVAADALAEFLKYMGRTDDYYKSKVKTFLHEIYNDALKQHKRKYFLDKTPRYYHIIEDLIEIFPEQKFIILLRNPLAVLNSILETWVKDDLSRICYYLDDLLVAPQRLVDVADKYTEKCFKVKYEELVEKPKVIIKSICEFINIDYNDELIQYKYDNSWKYGDQVGVKKNRRPNKGHIEKWKVGLKAPQKKAMAISYIETLGGELLKRMGYDYDTMIETLSGDGIPYDANISLKSIYDIIDTLSFDLDMKRVAAKLLESKGNIILDRTCLDNQLKKMVDYYISPKIDKLNCEKKQLEGEINRMKSTFSWRITRPIRNMRQLKKIVIKFKSQKNE